MVCVPGGSKTRHSVRDELVCVPGDSKFKEQVPDEREATSDLDTLRSRTCLRFVRIRLLVSRHVHLKIPTFPHVDCKSCHVGYCLPTGI